LSTPDEQPEVPDQLPARRDAARPLEAEVAGHDVSFEIALDDPDEVTPARPVPVDPLPAEGARLPIIPDHLRGLDKLKAATARAVTRWMHVSGYHAVRSPLYVVLAVFWAVVGVFRLLGRQLRWWWQPDAVRLESEAANVNDPATWTKVRNDAQHRRLFRFWVLLAQFVALGLVVLLLLVAAPLWLAALVIAAAIPALARVGRPASRPIVKPATVKSRFRKLNADIVLRAYYAAGLGHPDKPGQQIHFGSTMSRDATNSGSQVVIDLPYGRTFADVVAKKGQLASGVDVTEYQVFLTRDKTSTRRHLLFVADRDPLAVPAGRTPLLDCKVRDIWKPCLFGLDERGRKVCVDLMWNSILVGAQPRKGKTFSARLLALYAALDPYVKLFIADGKNSPDWRSFALVADRMVFGTAPSAREGDPVERLLDMLRLIKKHIQRVNEVLSRLPVEVCPEGKLTRNLARDLRYPELRVWMLVMEEFQVYYELDDQELNKEIAGLLSFIMAVGPSAGVIILSSSQKPSGVGAGDVQRLFNRYRDNHQIRFALKCGNRLVSEAVLGGDAYGEGYDAASLPVGLEYRGIGYLYGASDHVPTVRTHLADKVDAEKILVAARKHREQLGTLSGEAAGDVIIEAELVDPLADALSVILPTEANISWPRLAERLREQLPNRYAEITAEALSSRLRGLGATSKNVRDSQFFDSGAGKGVARADLEQLVAHRAVSR
jgi:hypothetical protein